MEASTLAPILPERLARAREPLLNLRGEDEAELSYLTNLIETLSWILFPSKHPTCVLGRVPHPRDASSTFCASLYSMGKGGVKILDLGPEVGESRKEVLGKLLREVEVEIGRMMLDDSRENRKRADVEKRERERV